jgi:hypothetical protein
MRADFPELCLSLSSMMDTPREVKWLLVIGCGLRIIFFYFSKNNGGDAFARAAVAVSIGGGVRAETAQRYR